jgi:hypothetical protein
MKLALAALCVSGVLGAQTPALSSTAPSRTVRSAAARDDGADAIRWKQALVEADSLEAAGRSGPARKRYRTLIDEQLAAGQYPPEAYWQLTNSYFFHDEEVRAAEVLEELASAASRFGDPAMELRATFESAIMFQRHKDNARVVPKVERVRALLKSPVIDAELKESIERRMVGG